MNRCNPIFAVRRLAKHDLDSERRAIRPGVYAAVDRVEARLVVTLKASAQFNPRLSIHASSLRPLRYRAGSGGQFRALADKRRGSTRRPLCSPAEEQSASEAGSAAARVDEGTICDLFGTRRHPTFGTLRAFCAALELALQSVISFQGLDAPLVVQNWDQE